MLPLRDSVRSRTFPAVTLWIIIVNVLCFAYEYSMGPDLGRFIQVHGFVPRRFFVAQSESWLDLSRFIPVFTSMFLHGDLIHLVSNMWILWIFGDNVEDSMGHGRYMVYYVVCGLAAVALQAAAQPGATVPMVGASGAIAGVLGGYFLTYPRARVLTLIPIFFFFSIVEVSAYFFLVLWFIIQFLQGTLHFLTVGSPAQGGVAWWAHVGGFVAGMILIPFFRRKRRRGGGTGFPISLR